MGNEGLKGTERKIVGEFFFLLLKYGKNSSRGFFSSFSGEGDHKRESPDRGNGRNGQIEMRKGEGASERVEGVERERERKNEQSRIRRTISQISLIFSLARSGALSIKTRNKKPIKLTPSRTSSTSPTRTCLHLVSSRLPSGKTTLAGEPLVLLSSAALVLSSAAALRAATASTNDSASVGPKGAKGETVDHQARAACDKK